jgi:ATP-dependent DNA helicase RecQ
VRPLVLKTVLAYLELDGYLRQGTPFYAGYSLRPAGDSLDEVYAAFDPARAEFLRRLVATGKTGRSWTTLQPDEAAAELGEERSRIVAALGHLEERGLVELKPADVRQRFTLLACPDSTDALIDALLERFERREQAETERIQHVVSLVTEPGCQVNALVAYFGERRDEPCGHCSSCLGEVPRALPEEAPASPVDSVVDEAALHMLLAEHAAALGSPRQRARFLCGIASPATTRAKLTRDPLFGSLANRRFADVLDWCAAAS